MSNYKLRITDIPCPCVKCGNREYFDKEGVRKHLILYGIRRGYTFWSFHGENRGRPERPSNEATPNYGAPSNEPILNYLQPYNEPLSNEPMCTHNYDPPSLENLNEPHDKICEDDKLFFRILNEGNILLYEGSRISKSSATLKLLNLKSEGQWSNLSFDKLLAFLKEELLPTNSTIPNSYYQCKKFLTSVGLSYDKIHACRNNCMLFRKDNTNLDSCKICGISRWKINEASGELRKKANGKYIPAKVLRYFPVTPRLRRLYICPKTAQLMTWHKNNRVDDEIMRHPADSLAWKSLDEEFPDFSSDPRNIRLGLASDGFQPFANGKTSYSIWPVILIPYNVAPTICMDPSNFILSMLIPGPESPGDAIDIYLEPLIEELKELWATGVHTFDAATSTIFNLRACLLWTINDFPAYANLSGWSTKGKLACPCCNKQTSSLRLANGKKECYMCHRRFLPQDHIYRRKKDLFDGTIEKRKAPTLLSGDEIFEQVRELKGRNLSRDPRKRDKVCHQSRGDNWNKMSIFFELPYWKTLLLRHNLDVMHIEKNICDSVLGTIMDIKGKTKDGVKTRQDLQLLNIRHHLHPINVMGVLHCPPAPYMLSVEKKKRLCQFLKKLKLPEGFSSNIGGCVNVKDAKISGLKSHDCHILLEYLLPLATRGLLEDSVYETVVNLSKFFRMLCAKSLKKDDLEDLQSNIVLTLCKLEQIFSPAFFDIMIHLPIHLAMEAMIGGPVQFRWMYPIEQYIGKLKGYVRNKYHLEASIAECYIVNETIKICARYFEQSSHNTLMSSPQLEVGLTIFLGMEELPLCVTHIYENNDKELAHLYILKNCLEAEPFYMYV